MSSPGLTGGDDFPAAWLRARASWPAQAAAVAVLALAVTRSVRTPGVGVDNRVVVRAARVFLDGGSPYADKRFLYLPSSVLLAVPEARLSGAVLHVLVPVVTAALILAGWWAALRVFGLSARSRLAVGVAGGLAYFAPFNSDVWLGNWTAISAAALPAALALAVRGRWTAAALVVGAAIACKPMLVPLALLFVFAREWRALGLLVAVPAATSVGAALAMPSPGLLLTKTLPFVLRGQDAYAKPYDASLVAVLPRLGLARPAATLIALALAAAVVRAAWLRWRRAGDQPLRLAETASMLMLAAFLVSRPAFLHYVLVVLPVLLASLPVRGSLPRSPWFWIVLLPQNTALQLPRLTGHRRAFKDALMLTGLALLALCHEVRRARSATRDAPREAAEPASGQAVEPASGQAVESASGQAVEPASGPAPKAVPGPPPEAAVGPEAGPAAASEPAE